MSMTQSLTVREDSILPRKSRSISVRHTFTGSRRPLVIKPSSNQRLCAEWAGLGGTFVDQRRGSRGLFLAETEDSRRDEDIINGSDPFTPKSAEEREEFGMYMTEEEEEFSSLAVVIMSAEITLERILAAAHAAIEDPKILITLYRAGMYVDGIEGKQKWVARKKVFETIQMIASAMIELDGVKKINHSFASVRDDRTGKTLLAVLAFFARREWNRHGYGHWTASRIMKAIGCPNVFDPRLS